MAMDHPQALPSLDIWTSALLSKSGAGRGGNIKVEAYGIKKLRELILELAVRGKLVAQDANDEPASELLKRIKAQKAELIATGKIRKDKPLPTVVDEEMSFDLPSGWAYSNLGEVVEIVRGITFPGNEKSKSPENGRIACLRTSNVQDQIEWDDILYIREEFVSREDQLLKPRDIVMSMANSRELVGKVALVGESINQKTTFGGFLGVLRPFLIDPRFVMSLLRTPHAREMLIDSASQTTNIANVSLAKLRPLFFAIPPLAEQHRIVAKVDELMALCDQLEQQQTDSLAAHQTLVETLLGTLTRVESQQEFSAAWARIANHFDTLFTTEASIDQLKQTLLQLAVMGKLVPQDPSDEPAGVLLQKIASERGRLARDGAIRAQQQLPEVSTTEIPYDLPERWVWTRLGNVGIGSTGKTPSTSNPDYYGGEVAFIGPGQITPAGEILDSDKTLTAEGCKLSAVAEPGDILMVCIGGSIGKSAIAFSQIAFNQQINCLRPLLVSSELLNYSMSTPQFQAAILEKATGSATPIINRSKWEELLVPIPPEAEQHRIVAKVDELMALCDALKARIKDAQTTQLHLADAIVEQAVC